MGNLLDTHTLIWFMNGNDHLSSQASKLIVNGTNYVSIASLWEIAIKISIGKLKLHFSYHSILEQLTENNFDILPITFEDTLSISTLGFHHRDPFDRILIAQSINNKLQLITKDESFGLYNIGVIW